VRLCYAVGARPNFVKMAPVFSALRRRAPEARHSVVHTEQHYDDVMSRVFIDQLDIPEPEHALGNIWRDRLGGPHPRAEHPG
jgi:UDP-N-acetylglucosamine 2-epimerase